MKTPDWEPGFFFIGFLRCFKLVVLRHEPNAINNAIGFAKFYSRSHHAVIRVYDEAGNVIDTHEQTGEFKESGEGAESGVV